MPVPQYVRQRQVAKMGRKSLLAGNALTTLEDVMDFIRLDPKDETIPDAAKNQLERLINAASSYIETMTGRRFGRQTYQEDHYGSGSQELCLEQYPIIRILRITDRENGKDMDPNSYSVSEMGAIGVVYRDEGWAPRGYVGGLANDQIAAKRYLRVEYTSGYILPKDATQKQPSDLPYDLQYIVWQMVQQQWGLVMSGANGLSAFSISDVSWTFDKELSGQVQEVISKYMRWS